MKNLIIMIIASLVMISCANNRQPDAAQSMVGANGRHASADADAISQGAGENARIVASDDQDEAKVQLPPGAHIATYHFDFDNSSIHEDDKADLNQQVEFLRNHPNAKVLLAGHTDEIGSREYNVALGERRAKSVLNYLRFAGVKTSQIRMLSYGQEKPKALGHNQAAYRINRRVELTYEAT